MAISGQTPEEPRQRLQQIAALPDEEMRLAYVELLEDHGSGGWPSNDFGGQAPGSAQEIKRFWGRVEHGRGADPSGYHTRGSARHDALCALPHVRTCLDAAHCSVSTAIDGRLHRAWLGKLDGNPI